MQEMYKRVEQKAKRRMRELVETAVIDEVERQILHKLYEEIEMALRKHPERTAEFAQHIAIACVKEMNTDAIASMVKSAIDYMDTSDDRKVATVATKMVAALFIDPTRLRGHRL